MTITCVVIFIVRPLIVYLSNPADFKGSLWETIAVCAFYVGITFPLLNIRIFLVLFFYRFNKVEIVSETGLFLLMFETGLIYNDDFENLWSIILLMLLYIVLKKAIVKFCLKCKKENVPQ